jgi:hypothetical protein
MWLTLRSPAMPCCKVSRPQRNAACRGVPSDLQPSAIVPGSPSTPARGAITNNKLVCARGSNHHHFRDGREWQIGLPRAVRDSARGIRRRSTRASRPVWPIIANIYPIQRQTALEPHGLACLSLVIRTRRRCHRPYSRLEDAVTNIALVSNRQSAHQPATRPGETSRKAHDILSCLCGAHVKFVLRMVR